jgi:hypothetical protein
MRNPSFSLDCACRAGDSGPTRRRRFASVRQQGLWMTFPTLPSNPKRRRASLAAAVQKVLPPQGQASLAKHSDPARSVCLGRPAWELGRLTRPGAAKGRYSGLRPRLRTGRPRSQAGFATPKNVLRPDSSLRGNDVRYSWARIHCCRHAAKEPHPGW